MTSLFPPRESLVSDILAGDGNTKKLFYGVAYSTMRILGVSVIPYEKLERGYRPQFDLPFEHDILK
jgi:hypothetical protein